MKYTLAFVLFMCALNFSCHAYRAPLRTIASLGSTLAACAGMAYASHEIINNRKKLCKMVVHNAALHRRMKRLPWLYEHLIVNPLVEKVHYHSLSEFLQESEEDIKKRQRKAEALARRGIPLLLSPTEADLLTHSQLFHTKRNMQERLRESLQDLFCNTVSKNINEHEALEKGLRLIDTIYKTEKDAADAGDVILYHAMPAPVYAANYIGTRLHAVCENVDNLKPEFLELRHDGQESVKMKLEGSWQSDKAFININDTNCAQVLLHRKGFDSYSEVQGISDSKLNKWLLSVQTSLTANIANHPESTLFFWMHGHDGGAYKLPDTKLQDMLNYYNIPSELVKTYQERFAKEMDTFVKDSVKGVLLQIILSSPSLVNDTTYPAHRYGYRRNVYQYLSIHENRHSFVDEEEKSNKLSLYTQAASLFKSMRNNPFRIHLQSLYYDPEGYSEIGSLQFRVVIDPARLRNITNKAVTNNFTVHAYGLNQECLKQFRTTIDKIVQDLAKDMNLQTPPEPYPF